MDKKDVTRNTLVIDISFQIENSKSNNGHYKSSGVVLLFIGALGGDTKSDYEWKKINSTSIKRCKSNILDNTKNIILDHQVITIPSIIKLFMVVYATHTLMSKQGLFI